MPMSLEFSGLITLDSEVAEFVHTKQMLYAVFVQE